MVKRSSIFISKNLSTILVYESLDPISKNQNLVWIQPLMVWRDFEDCLHSVGSLMSFVFCGSIEKKQKGTSCTAMGAKPIQYHSFITLHKFWQPCWFVAGTWIMIDSGSQINILPSWLNFVSDIEDFRGRTGNQSKQNWASVGCYSNAWSNFDSMGRFKSSIFHCLVLKLLGQKGFFLSEIYRKWKRGKG